MTLLINCLCVGAGGFFGSIFRYLLGMLPLGSESGFPYTTLLVNVIGAFLIGLIVSYFTRSFPADHQILLFLKVGLCGGFTTFSAFTLESLKLFQNGESLSASFYIVTSVVLCLAAAFFGEYVVSK